MNINMEEQFVKLKAVIDKVSKFSFGLNREYLGPIDPSSIVTFGSGVVKVNAIILAERVPALHLPYNFGENHLEAVTAFLDDNFEFQQYHTHINELLGLSVLVGDPEYSYDGTVAGATEYFQKKNWSFSILYEQRSE
jgi:hypothetical protein